MQEGGYAGMDGDGELRLKSRESQDGQKWVSPHVHGLTLRRGLRAGRIWCRASL